MGKDSDKGNAAYWEELLAKEGMPAQLPPEKLGKQVVLGDGLGRKTNREELIEDGGKGHSKMCPINLRVAINADIDQPTDNPLERHIVETETGHEAEETLRGIISEELLDLTAHLGLTETTEMTQLRERTARPMDDATFTLLLEQYIRLSDEQVNSNVDGMAFLRAQVAGILLNALVYLSNRRFEDYTAMLDAAAEVVPNLEDVELSEKISQLFL